MGDRQMNDKKICFIMCVNDKMYEEECIRYIENLDVPEGYQVEQLSIWGAKSMCAGYNEGMQASDAKYKVYLHQDVFIVKKDFIYDLLRVFENSEIGMTGAVGSPTLSKDAIMWSGKRIGWVFSSDIKESGEAFIGTVKAPYEEVEALDGLLNATQYEVPWREDIFTGWDFYDISQSMEMRKNHYKVVVPQLTYPWCLHDSEYINLEKYFYWRDVFLDEYGDMIK